jgi:tRNA-dihydrouridine synthase B
MIGRGALGRPWVFDPAFEKLSPEEQREKRFETILRHMELICEHMPERFALVQMKKHLVWYASGQPNSAATRNAIYAQTDCEAVLDVFGEYWASETRAVQPS